MRILALEQGETGRCSVPGLVRGLKAVSEDPKAASAALKEWSKAVQSAQEREWTPQEQLAYRAALDDLEKALETFRSGPLAAAAMASDPECAASGDGSHHVCAGARTSPDAVCVPEGVEGRFRCETLAEVRRACSTESVDSSWAARFCPQIRLSPRCRAVYRDAWAIQDCKARREFLETETATCLPAGVRRDAVYHCYDGDQPLEDWTCPQGSVLTAKRGCCDGDACKPPVRRVRGYERLSSVDVPADQDLAQLVGLRRHECEEACNGRRDCAAFTREVEDDEAPGFCWLKSGTQGAAQCDDCGRVLFRKVLQQ